MTNEMKLQKLSESQRVINNVGYLLSTRMKKLKGDEATAKKEGLAFLTSLVTATDKEIETLSAAIQIEASQNASVEEVTNVHPEA